MALSLAGNPLTGDEFFMQIDDFLSKAQCIALLERADIIETDDLGNKAWHRAGTGGGYMRVLMIDTELAAELWDRVEPFLPEGKEYRGYKLLYLNSHFRFSKYNKDGHFPVHCDGKNYDSARPDLTGEYGAESLFTLNIFLNDDFTGGATDFLVPVNGEMKLRYSVKPAAGRAALFWGDQYHRGERVETPYKYLLRTDVMGMRLDGPT